MKVEKIAEIIEDNFWDAEGGVDLERAAEKILALFPDLENWEVHIHKKVIVPSITDGSDQELENEYTIPLSTALSDPEFKGGEIRRIKE